MGLFDSVRRAKDALTAGLRGEGPSEEALASLSPEQRAAHDRALADAAAAQAEATAAHAAEHAAYEQRRRGGVLRGPAGDWLAAGTPDMLSPEQIASMDTAALLAWQTEQTKAQLQDLVRTPLGRRRPPPPPPGPPPLADPAAQAAAERAARDAARAAYLAPNRVPVRITRLAADARSELDEVAAHLGASGLADRPDLVFGCYRVPDAIGGGFFGGPQSSYVEWDVVHADAALPAGNQPAAVVRLAGEERWVRRGIGQPSVADEDLGIAYLRTAGLGSERSCGLARTLRIWSEGGGDEGSMTATLIEAVDLVAFHPPTGPDPNGDPVARLRAASPLDLPLAGHPEVHLVALNWQAIAEVVHPARHRAAPVPSPFPYLPGTPQELLRSYLDIVGVHPAHCYAASVTEDDVRSIHGAGTWGPMEVRTNVGEEQPCADGRARRRLRGGSLVVVAYLDTPTYAEGRQRWEAYERDVLQASLQQGTGLRRPVEAPEYHDLPRGLRGLARAAEVAGHLWDWNASEAFADHRPHRYCWPPELAER